MVDWAKPETISDAFVETTSAKELRVQRVWRFVTVMWSTWAFFFAFLAYRQYSDAASVCFLSAAVLLLINVASLRTTNCARLLHFNLAVSAIGLLAVSFSDPALESTMLFYPVAILVSSQLLGLRAALSWLAISIVALVGYYGGRHGIGTLASASHLDEMVLLVGVSACTYFCCQQGEAYYQKRTQSLILLSQQLRRKSDKLAVLATTDALTGLMNRFQFLERLSEAVQNANDRQHRLTLFLIDMDGFKEINDTMGHGVGDEALMEIANRLMAAFGSQADVARLGGDEFCIIHASLKDTKQCEAFAKEVIKVLLDRYVLNETECPLSASVGYAFCPDDATTSKDLLAFADTAMFYAKDHKLGFAGYTSDMSDSLIEYRTTQEKLSQALQANEFFLVYQPQVSLGGNEMIGVEALLRWRHEGEVISPVKFIPLLEQSRMILSVSSWVIRECCQQIAIWNQMGCRTTVSINVSPLQFTDPDFVKCIEQSVEETGIEMSQLDFEITEGSLIKDVPDAVRTLNKIKDLGATISIDDFGTGYSSLSYLRQFPIDRLKIDRTFVKDIPDADDGVIASAVIALAKSLGMKVLAEGVETKQQLDFLGWHDCDEYQGYYYSPPRPASEISRRLEAQSNSLTIS